MGTTKGTPEHTPSEKNSEGDNETLQGRQAEELFPDFFEQSAKGKYDGPAVPQPPGDSWLESDNAESREDAGLQALVLMESIHHAQVEQTLQEMGYATVAVQSAEQALEQFRTAQYHLVLCGINTVYSSFHNYITQSVVQQRRRLLYYVLIGPQVHTCYDLQALAFSANLVINEQELPHLAVILRKGFRDYTKLFGPFLEVLGEERLPVIQ